MSHKILFIFEGIKPEKHISESLFQFFLNENTIVTCAYCTTIYKMYAEISADLDLDTFNLIKNVPVNFEILKDFKRTDFAEIYLFFDYDGHASNANDQKLRDLLLFFNEETDKGKLLISYPMAEALRHVEDLQTFESLTFNIINFEKYKSHTVQFGLTEFQHFNDYTLNTWAIVIDLHLKKMNKIVIDLFQFPDKQVDQLTLFTNQKEKYIDLNNSVAVLSAFPVFLFDYYGVENLKAKLQLI
jgi:hypothetical protein